MADLIPADLTTLDCMALAWFLLAWLGYGAAIHAVPWAGSISARMDEVRRVWITTMLDRENRITDASLIGHTVHSASFFASTTMVALAAVLGTMGAFDQGYGVLHSLAFTAKTSRSLAEAKLLLLALVFAHTFMKLSWALRQLNYCIAMIGAAPLKAGMSERDTIAEPIAAVLCLAIRSFNAGIRGYLFALAAISWLLGPLVMLLVTTGMVGVLLWRQFFSATATAVGKSHAVLVPAIPAARSSRPRPRSVTMLHIPS